MIPPYGWYISTIKNIAAETDSAHTRKLPITVAFGGANNPKLTNSATSQNTRQITSETEIVPADCSYISQRACSRSNAKFDARVCSIR